LRSLITLETHLSIRTFLVGDRITSADITAASIPQHIVSVISDAAVRAKLINTVRFLETIVHQPKRRTFLVGDRITPADNTDAYI
jgi:elongation factor 1-gamma